MGWFDDSDSDDETGAKRKPPLELFDDVKLEPPKTSTSGIQKAPIESNTQIVTQKSDGPQKDTLDAEDDPLDSYMNSISSNDGVDKMKQSIHRGRLDLDNEDEATAHWKCISVINKSVVSETGESREQESDGVESIHYNYESLKAKAEMASTFHKPGEAKKQAKDDSSKQVQKEFAEEYDQYDEHHIDRKKGTIDPLEKVDHSTVDYQPFRKRFHQSISTDVGGSWRKKNQVTCSISIDPVLSFEQYGPSKSKENEVFAKEILTYLAKNGFHQATPVQAQSIPVALAGHDLLVTSRTGSGKTLAYVLPLVTHVIDQPHIVPNIDGPIVIILTPTRELAKQVNLIIKKILHVVGGKSVAVTGGSGTYEMAKELKKGCEVIVSTPGRLIDMVKRKATNPKRITLVVLDEADKMLEMGFESQCSSILNSVRPDRQTFMFSATFGKRVERVAKGWLRHPVRIAIGHTGSSSEHVEQQVLVLPTHDAKVLWLLEMVPILHAIGKMIIFVQSRAEVDSITQELRNSPLVGGSGLSVDSIHGDRHQSDRNAALSALRKGKIVALIATDVAARGLDVDDIMTVINFDPAKNLDSHVHRIGRAGRLNKDSPEHKKGVAYTLLTPKNADFAHTLIEAFQREGREVNNDLLALSMNSKRYGGQGAQLRRNRHGLGYVQEDDPHRKRSRWT